MTESVLKIIFNKSTSSQYETAIKLAKKFSDFNQDNKLNTININTEELNKKYYEIRECL